MIDEFEEKIYNEVDAKISELEKLIVRKEIKEEK